VSTQFVDTNIFLRYLTEKDTDKHRACYALFKRAEGNQVSLTTSESVIAEVVFVLSSRKHYNVSRPQIQRALARLLILPGLKITHQATFLRALDLYVTHPIDFEDCLSVAHMERQQLRKIYSYDQDFDRFARIKRLEPERTREVISDDPA